MTLVTLADIQEAQSRIAPVVYHTPLIKAQTDSGLYFKPESLQPIGSFKIRGAYNKIASIPAAERARGVIAYSSGNHAQGVAYSAKSLGIPAVIVMPSSAPQIKIDLTRSYGAEVVLYDILTQSREVIAADLQAKHGFILVPPFNDLKVIAGQGTIGAEIADDLAEVDLVLTPVGGGGLLSGVATALKSLKPSVKVIGVEPSVAADAQASLRSGQIVSVLPTDVQKTIADGVRTLSIGELTLAQMQQYADDIITVSEDELIQAVREMVLTHKLTIEPTSALPLAAWRYHRNELPPARNTVLVLSGGNVDPAQLAGILQTNR